MNLSSLVLCALLCFKVAAPIDSVSNGNSSTFTSNATPAVNAANVSPDELLNGPESSTASVEPHTVVNEENGRSTFGTNKHATNEDNSSFIDSEVNVNGSVDGFVNATDNRTLERPSTDGSDNPRVSLVSDGLMEHFDIVAGGTFTVDSEENSRDERDMEIAQNEISDDGSLMSHFERFKHLDEIVAEASRIDGAYDWSRPAAEEGEKHVNKRHVSLWDADDGAELEETTAERFHDLVRAQVISLLGGRSLEEVTNDRQTMRTLMPLLKMLRGADMARKPPGTKHGHDELVEDSGTQGSATEPDERVDRVENNADKASLESRDSVTVGGTGDKHGVLDSLAEGRGSGNSQNEEPSRTKTENVSEGIQSGVNIMKINDTYMVEVERLMPGNDGVKNSALYKHFNEAVKDTLRKEILDQQGSHAEIVRGYETFEGKGGGLMGQGAQDVSDGNGSNSTAVSNFGDELGNASATGEVKHHETRHNDSHVSEAHSEKLHHKGDKARKSKKHKHLPGMRDEHLEASGILSVGGVGGPTVDARAPVEGGSVSVDDRDAHVGKHRLVSKKMHKKTKEPHKSSKEQTNQTDKVNDDDDSLGSLLGEVLKSVSIYEVHGDVGQINIKTDSLEDELDSSFDDESGTAAIDKTKPEHADTPGRRNLTGTTENTNDQRNHSPLRSELVPAPTPGGNSPTRKPYFKLLGYTKATPTLNSTSNQTENTNGTGNSSESKVTVVTNFEDSSNSTTTKDEENNVNYSKMFEDELYGYEDNETSPREFKRESDMADGHSHGDDGNTGIAVADEDSAGNVQDGSGDDNEDGVDADDNGSSDDSNADAEEDEGSSDDDNSNGDVDEDGVDAEDNESSDDDSEIGDGDDDDSNVDAEGDEGSSEDDEDGVDADDNGSSDDDNEIGDGDDSNVDVEEDEGTSDNNNSDVDEEGVDTEDNGSSDNDNENAKEGNDDSGDDDSDNETHKDEDKSNVGPNGAHSHGTDIDKKNAKEGNDDSSDDDSDNETHKDEDKSNVGPNGAHSHGTNIDKKNAKEGNDDSSDDDSDNETHKDEDKSHVGPNGAHSHRTDIDNKNAFRVKRIHHYGRPINGTRLHRGLRLRTFHTNAFGQNDTRLGKHFKVRREKKHHLGINVTDLIERNRNRGFKNRSDLLERNGFIMRRSRTHAIGKNGTGYHHDLKIIKIHRTSNETSMPNNFTDTFAQNQTSINSTNVDVLKQSTSDDTAQILDSYTPSVGEELKSSMVATTDGHHQTEHVAMGNDSKLTGNQDSNPDSPYNTNLEQPNSETTSSCVSIGKSLSNHYSILIYCSTVIILNIFP